LSKRCKISDGTRKFFSVRFFFIWRSEGTYIHTTTLQNGTGDTRNNAIKYGKGPRSDDSSEGHPVSPVPSSGCCPWWGSFP
jgi:hypothetical protein